MTIRAQHQSNESEVTTETTSQKAEKKLREQFNYGATSQGSKSSPIFTPPLFFLAPIFHDSWKPSNILLTGQKCKISPSPPQLPHLFYMEKIFYQMEKVGWKNNKITISNRLYLGVKIVTLGLPFFGLLLWFMIGFLMGNIVVQLCNRYTAFILV